MRKAGGGAKKKKRGGIKYTLFKGISSQELTYVLLENIRIIWYLCLYGLYYLSVPLIYRYYRISANMILHTLSLEFLSQQVLTSYQSPCKIALKQLIQK